MENNKIIEYILQYGVPSVLVLIIIISIICCLARMPMKVILGLFRIKEYKVIRGGNWKRKGKSKYNVLKDLGFMTKANLIDKLAKEYSLSPNSMTSQIRRLTKQGILITVTPHNFAKVTLDLRSVKHKNDYPYYVGSETYEKVHRLHK